MGLGKTVQAISFLAYLQQQSPSWKYLVVVPSSTLGMSRGWWRGGGGLTGIGANATFGGGLQPAAKSFVW